MTTEPSATPNTSLDLAQLFAIVLAKKKTVGITILCSLLLAVVYLHVATYRYTVLLKVAPAQSNSSSGRGLASALSGSGLGDLASMAGVNLGGGASGGSQFQLYIESLPSRSVADVLARRTDLMKVIFSREWSEENHAWHPPGGVLRSIANGVKSVLGYPPQKWQPPDGARLQDYLEDSVTIAQSAKQVLVTIKLVHEDPVFAEHFLEALHEVADNQLRQKTFVRSTQYIAYLNHILPTVTVAEQRQAIAASLNEQQKNLMMAGTRTSFAAEPFGGAYATEKPTTPVPTITILVAIVAGAFLGVIIVIVGASGWVSGLRRAVRRERKKERAAVAAGDAWRYPGAATVLERKKSPLT